MVEPVWLGVTTGDVGLEDCPDLAGFGGTTGLFCILEGFGGSGGAGLPSRSVDEDENTESSSSKVGVGDRTETSIEADVLGFVLPVVLLPKTELRRETGGVDDAAEWECLLTISSALAKQDRITDIMVLY
jgi:hypothetical protein